MALGYVFEANPDSKILFSASGAALSVVQNVNHFASETNVFVLKNEKVDFNALTRLQFKGSGNKQSSLANFNAISKGHSIHRKHNDARVKRSTLEAPDRRKIFIDVGGKHHRKQSCLSLLIGKTNVKIQAKKVSVLRWLRH